MVAMHRFFCPNLAAGGAGEGSAGDRGGDGEAAGGRVVRLNAGEAEHARRVLRVRVGETVELFDGQGSVGEGMINSWTDGAQVRVSAVSRVDRITPLLEIACAIPKGRRADELVQQLSQLGVDRLVPLSTERSVVNPRETKLERFRRSAIESAKQCGRAFLMEVAEPIALGVLLKNDSGFGLIADRDAGSAGRGRERLAALHEQIGSAPLVTVLIGPEGGWTAAERDAAIKAGFQHWCVGPYTLRIETAAAAAAAVVRYIARNPDGGC